MIYAMPYSLRWNNPRYWHRRAEEARTVGQRMSNIEARTGMLRLAADYEVMANAPRNEGNPSGSGRAVTARVRRAARNIRPFVSIFLTGGGAA